MRNAMRSRLRLSAAGGRFPTLPLALLLALLGLGPGCSSSTGPDVPPPRVVFAPDADTVRTDLGSTVNFSVTTSNLPAPQITFVRDDLVVGTTANLPYQATSTGVDRLRAIVSGGGQTWERSWTIVVGDIDRPPVVLNLALADGLTPSAVLVSWRRPAAGWPLPLVAYEVAVREGTPPTAQDWAAQRIASVPVAGPAESHEYGLTDSPLIVADAQLYFGIRTVDEAGDRSPVVVAGPWRVTRSWEITGVLRDDLGQPLANKLIAYNLELGCDTCRVVTGAGGAFRLGPVRERDAFFLQTKVGATEYYEFRTPAVDIETPLPLEIVVIRRRAVLAACAAVAYPGADGFFDLLLDLSKTDQTWTTRDNYELLKWTAYPVPVHVQAGVGSQGVDLGAAARAAVAAWNAVPGGPYLRLVDAPPDTGIIVVSGPSPYPGLTEMLLPVSSGINESVPVRVRVLLREDLYVESLAREIAMHELGHAIGLGGHSRCASHLLTDAFTQGLTITADEIAVMRAVRALPQGTPMDRYLR